MKTWIMTTSIPKQAKKLLAAGSDVETCNAMVAGETKREIISAFKAYGVECSPYLLREYGTETSVGTYESALCETYPGQVFVQKLNDNNAAWHEIASLESLTEDVPEDGLELLLRSADNGKPVGWVGAEEFDLRDEIVGYPV